jgi:hypothetical protein
MGESASIEKHKITSVSGFLKLVEVAKAAEEGKADMGDFIFRGQREDKPLRPRLGRLVARGSRRKIERLMFDEFKRTSIALSEFQRGNDWDFLSVAQHHGLPTRLLDWTYSALAALWFAVEKEPAEIEGIRQNAVVWILKTLPEDFIDPGSQETPFDDNATRIYRPRVVSRRIAVQRGIFTVHRMMPPERFIAFESNRSFKERLIKVIVDSSSFAQIRKHLDGCGMNRSILFPDLEGLCAHLEWRYTQLPDEP